MLLLTSPLIAQITAHNFSLNDAINYGMGANTEYLNTELDAEIQRKRAFEVMTEGFPKISAKLDYNYYFEQQVSIIPPGSFGPAQTQEVEAIFQQPHAATLKADIQQLVFDARYIYGLKAVDGFYKMADAQVELGRINTTEQITKAYYNALVAKSASERLASNEAILEKLLFETTKIYEEGLTDELSVNRLELNLSNLQTQIKRAEQQSQNALLNLKFVMGMPSEETLELTEDLQSIFSTLQMSVNSSADPENRVENEILTTQLEMQLYDVKQARSSYFPNIYAFGSYGTLAQRERFTFFDTEEQWFDFGMVGFTINVPIFDGLTARSQVQQRQLNRQIVANQLEQFNRSMELEVAVGVNNLENAINEYNTQSENLALAQKILNKTIIMFNEGVGSSLELSSAQQELTSSQIMYSQSIYNMLVAQFDLNKALGNL